MFFETKKTEAPSLNYFAQFSGAVLGGQHALPQSPLDTYRAHVPFFFPYQEEDEEIHHFPLLTLGNISDWS